MFVFVPELHGIDDVLPNNVGAWCDDGYGIKEGMHEPDAYHVVLLPQSLSAIDTLAPYPADSFAKGEEYDADHQGQKQQQQ